MRHCGFISSAVLALPLSCGAGSHFQVVVPGKGNNWLLQLPQRTENTLFIQTLTLHIIMLYNFQSSTATAAVTSSGSFCVSDDDEPFIVSSDSLFVVASPLVATQRVKRKLASKYAFG